MVVPVIPVANGVAHMEPENVYGLPKPQNVGILAMEIYFPRRVRPMQIFPVLPANFGS